MPLVTDVSYPSLIPVTVGKPGKRRALGKPLKRKPYHYHSVALGRKPTPLEERLLSLTTIPGALDMRSAAMVDALRLLRTAMIADVSRPALMRDLTEETRAVLLDGLLDAAQYGAAEHNLEWVRQGAALTLAHDWVESAITSNARLHAVTRTRAEQLAREWRDWALETDERLRVSQPNAPAALWRTLVLRRLDTGLMSAARAIINLGFASGRAAERHRLVSLKRVKPELLVFTAVLDKNTCPECEDADGTEFEEGSAEETEFQVPYALCEGGNNCRCMIVAVGSEPGWVNAVIDHLAIVNLDAAASVKAWDTRGRGDKKKGKVRGLTDQLDPNTEADIIGGRLFKTAETIVESLPGEFTVELQQADSDEYGEGISFRATSAETIDRGDGVQVPAVKMSREFFRDQNGQLVVHHDLFRLHQSVQAQGVGKEVMRAQLNEYQRLGADRIETEANLDMGGYAWARYGFSAKRPEDVATQIELQFEGDDNPELEQEHAVLRSIIDKYRHDPHLPWHLSDAFYNGRQIAKEYMRGISWTAVLDLHDPASVKRLTRYLDQPHGH